MIDLSTLRERYIAATVRAGEAEAAARLAYGARDNDAPAARSRAVAARRWAGILARRLRDAGEDPEAYA